MSTTGHPGSLPGYDTWLASEPTGTVADDTRTLVLVRCLGCTDPELAAPWEADGVEDAYGRRYLRDADRACGECGSDLVVLSD
jgi:hypothetical protein